MNIELRILGALLVIVSLLYLLISKKSHQTDRDLTDMFTLFK